MKADGVKNYCKVCNLFLFFRRGNEQTCRPPADCREINKGRKNMKAKLTLISTNLRRYTFQSPKIKSWVESRATGHVLNLFSGKTLLNLDEIRNDIDVMMPADFHKDAFDFIKGYQGPQFDVIILDPPYAYRKAMEMYNGNYSSRFKLIADHIPIILTKAGVVISFGYHSTFMGKIRNFELIELCVFAHGGAQHCTIGIIERRI